MKTKEELNALKEEVEVANKKLHELTDEELEKVAGGLSDGDVVYGLKCTACGRIIGFASLGASSQQRKQEENFWRYNEKGCPDCYARKSMGKITGYWSDDARNIVWNS